MDCDAALKVTLRQRGEQGEPNNGENYILLMKIQLTLVTTAGNEVNIYD